MKRVKKAFNYIAILSAIMVVLPVAFIGYFLVKHDAPILSGDFEYDVEYKAGLGLDLYKPIKNKYSKSPIVFYLHGGAWVTGSKLTLNNNRFNGAINRLRNEGYTIVSPSYTLATEGKSPFPDCIIDIYDAIEWTKRNADKYNLDTTSMGILGESAGAQIAMMIAFPDTTIQANKYPKTNFKYIIDVYGPNELEGIYRSKLVDSIDVLLTSVPIILRDNFDVKKKIFGFNPLEDSARAQMMIHEYSPILFINKYKVPVLIIHGKDDVVVPVKQSIDLKNKLDSMGIINEMHLLDKVNHGFIGASTAQLDAIQVWISDFVLKYSSGYKK